MTTAPRISGAGSRPGRLGGIPGLLRAPLVLSLLSGSAATGSGAVLEGSAAAVGAALGTVMVVVFFGAGAVVLDVVARLVPAAALLVALLTYVLQVLLLGLVFVGLARSGALGDTVDAGWLGVTVIVVTGCWLAAQVRSTMTARIPLYHLPEDLPERPADELRGPREAGAR